MKFSIHSSYQPSGDQPQAIRRLVGGLRKKMKYQTLLGVTGSGKTFTMANVIAKVNKPTLVIAHNKTLAAQLVSEFREFFPNNAVEYFVSYYDYYQPEAYMPTTDKYISKEVEINKEIEKLRHKATAELMSRRDVIIVASVSCIYGLGAPEMYQKEVLFLRVGMKIEREEFIKRLVSMYYARSEVLLSGKFRVVGGSFEVMLPSSDIIVRVELSGGEVVSLVELDAVSRSRLSENMEVMIFPAKHFVVDNKMLQDALRKIQKELTQRLRILEKMGKVVEMERLERRTKYDLEMITELGYCNGIENYSRYLTNRKAGEAPYTLMDYFPKDFLLFIDESHVTLPQLRAMYGGDQARKKTLIDYGFRLPSAADNRPLTFSEFESRIAQAVFVSATPAEYEKKVSEQIVEQIVRPTGLLDPLIEVRPLENQVDDLAREIKECEKRGERVLVTTLTKKMAEDLDNFLQEMGIKSKYLHSDIDTLDRVVILRELREGKFNCLVGVNLLREGLDIPEVTLVGILDADKEGFLRNETSLIQTMGRAARNVNGRVILYADHLTGSIRAAISETTRRRKLQEAYNIKHNITPQTIQKNIYSLLGNDLSQNETSKDNGCDLLIPDISQIPVLIAEKEKQMRVLAKSLQFEEAALIRDEVGQLKKILRLK